MKRKLFTRIAIAIFIALLAAIAIPNFIGARTTSAQNACANNLRWLDGAKQQWQLENKKRTNDTPTFQELEPYLGRSHLPSCPQGGTYILGRVGEAPGVRLVEQMEFIDARLNCPTGIRQDLTLVLRDKSGQQGF